MGFEEIEKKEEKENKKVAGVSTAIIVAALIALMFFIFFGGGMEGEDAFDGGGGVAVSFGQPDAGGPSSEASAPQSKNASPQETVDDPILSQDDDNAPTVKQQDKPKTQPTVPQRKADSDLSDILGDLANRKKTQGTGFGSQSGNQGDPNGADGANGTGGSGGGDGGGDGSGSGKGTGVSYSLGNRKMTVAPPSTSDYTSNGTVTLKIWVNKEGKVTDVRIDRPSSNDIGLQSLAKDLAYKTRFDASFTAATEQVGKLTIRFKL